MAQWVKAPVQCPESTKKLSPVSLALQQQDGKWRRKRHLEGGGWASLRHTKQQKQDPHIRVEVENQLLGVVHRHTMRHVRSQSHPNENNQKDNKSRI